MTKPVIVTRVGKGTPLTTAEGDANFNNLKNATINVLANGITVTNDLNDTFEIEAGTGITVAGNNTTKKVTITNSKLLSSETAPALGGNLNVSGNSIVSTSNGDITIAPHGTGKIVLDGQNWPTADGTANQYLKTNGSGQLSYATFPATALIEDIAPILGANLDVSTFKIITNSNNRNIELDPHGTGVVAVTGALTVSGNLTVSGTTTTVNSTTVDIADLNITLAKGAASAAAANGAGITIEGPGTPAVMEYVSATDRFLFNKQIAGSFFSNAASNFSGGTVNLGSNSNVTLTGGSVGQVLRTDGAGVLTWITPAAAGIATVSADTTPSLGGNLNVNGNSIVSSSNANINIAPHGSGKVAIGSGSVAGKLTTNGAYNLVLTTNDSSDSGTITITQGINGDITLVPNGTGKVRFNNVYSFPTADGSADQFLKTNGSGQLSFASVTSGFVGTATSDLDMTTFKIKSSSSQDLAFETASGSYGMTFKSNTMKFGYLDSAVTVTTNGTANLSLSTNSGTNSSVISISNGTNGNINLTPNGTGFIKVGPGNLAGKITTNGAYNLILSTNEAASSGTIVINQGTNGNIGLNPDGTGKIMLNAGVGISATSGTPATYNTSYFEGTLDTPAGWLKIEIGGTDRYLPYYS